MPTTRTLRIFKRSRTGIVVNVHVKGIIASDVEAEVRSFMAKKWRKIVTDDIHRAFHRLAGEQHMSLEELAYAGHPYRLGEWPVSQLPGYAEMLYSLAAKLRAEPYIVNLQSGELYSSARTQHYSTPHGESVQFSLEAPHATFFDGAPAILGVGRRGPYGMIGRPIWQHILEYLDGAPVARSALVRGARTIKPTREKVAEAFVKFLESLD